MYRCPDVAVMLAAYAVDALPGEERLQVVEHLAECRVHDDELQTYRSVTAHLPLVLPVSLSSPATLRAELLEAFGHQIAGTPYPELPVPPEPVPLARKAQTNSGLKALFRQPALAYGIAAALLVAVVGLAAWNLSLQDDETVVLQATSSLPEMTLEARYDTEQRIVVLDFELPPAPEGRVYQAWLVKDEQASSLGRLPDHKGRVAFAIDDADASAVMISTEASEGSDNPTGITIAAQFGRGD